MRECSAHAKESLSRSLRVGVAREREILNSREAYEEINGIIQRLTAINIILVSLLQGEYGQICRIGPAIERLHRILGQELVSLAGQITTVGVEIARTQQGDER
jgi:hypothetical protein